MTGFFKDVNLVYIIGIISALIGGVWAFYRFVYEKKLERFKEASTNLFVGDENQVLAAVAHLGVFKKDMFFKRNTVAVLLTKLYRELNYDTSNAIVSALIDLCRRDELLYIASEILGISRNLFFQTQPYKDRLTDINTQYGRLDRILSNDSKELEGSLPLQNQTQAIEQWKQKLRDEFIEWDNVVNKELLWHKQIMADTYSRIIRRAYNLNIPARVVFLNYVEQIFYDWNFRFYGKRIPIDIYQNAFAYIHMVQFKTSKCRIRRSGFESSIIADIEFNNIRYILYCTFTKASIRDCKFKRGHIRNSLMAETYFTNVHFTGIKFHNIYFIDAYFVNCSFTNCKGLSSRNFHHAEIDQRTILPEGISRDEIRTLKLSDLLMEMYLSDMRENDKDDLIGRCTSKIRTGAEFLDFLDTPLDRGSYLSKFVSQVCEDFPKTRANEGLTVPQVFK